MKGNTVTSGHLLSSVSPSNARVQSAFFQNPLQDREGRKKAPIKKIQREMYFTCRALFLLSSQMECLLKKPISLTTVLKGSKRALQQTAASLTASAEQTLFQVPPGFRLTMSVAHVSARSVCLFVCFKKGGSFLHPGLLAFQRF